MKVMQKSTISSVLFLVISLLLGVAVTSSLQLRPAASRTADQPQPAKIQRESLASGQTTLPATELSFTPRYTAMLPLVMNNTPPVTVFGVEMSSVSSGSGLNQVAQANTTWVRRAGIWWPDVEPTQGARIWPNLSSFEKEFQLLVANSLRPIVVIRGTPSWAQKVPGSYCGPVASTKLTAFASFVHDVVVRYSAPPYNVKYWEIINEPDVDPSLVSKTSLFGCWGDKNDTQFYGGAYYGTMLQTVYPAIKSADKDAQVLVGGLLLNCDPVNPPPPLTLSYCLPSKFFEGILQKYKGTPFFDGVAIHAYDYWAKNPDTIMNYNNTNWSSQSYSNGPVLIAKTNYIKSLLTKYKVTNTYLMATEVAMVCNRDPGTSCDGQPIFENAKAIYIAQIYPTSIAIGMKSAIWFSVMYSGWESTWLLNGDLSPKPAFTAAAVSRAILGNAQYSGPITPADIGGVTGVMGYKFLDKGKRIWTVWSMDGSTKTLTLPSTPVAITGTLGIAIPVTTNQVVLVQTVNQLFQYIRLDP